METDEYLVRSLFASVDYRPYAWYCGQKTYVSILVTHTPDDHVKNLKWDSSP